MVNMSFVDRDPAAAEKHRLRIIRIRIIVIIIILWYNKDIRLPLKLRGEPSDSLLYGTMKPLGRRRLDSPVSRPIGGRGLMGGGGPPVDVQWEIRAPLIFSRGAFTFVFEAPADSKHSWNHLSSISCW